MVLTPQSLQANPSTAFITRRPELADPIDADWERADDSERAMHCMVARLFRFARGMQSQRRATATCRALRNEPRCSLTDSDALSAKPNSGEVDLRDRMATDVCEISVPLQLWEIKKRGLVVIDNHSQAARQILLDFACFQCPSAVMSIWSPANSIDGVACTAAAVGRDQQLLLSFLIAAASILGPSLIVGYALYSTEQQVADLVYLDRTMRVNERLKGDMNVHNDGDQSRSSSLRASGDSAKRYLASTSATPRVWKVARLNLVNGMFSCKQSRSRNEPPSDDNWIAVSFRNRQRAVA
ncbi:hypothetical protein NM688_g4621 [Phlebia brevispora]|uniref:Uncharacterized protein n=1 Tax=Phlebia brevispora TaxID=194682 RepID=A0ACC1T2F5_9APHY|nr:hypothetical protein NM688_g4621 [Phlebia brevispora]